MPSLALFTIHIRQFPTNLGTLAILVDVNYFTNLYVDPERVSRARENARIYDVLLTRDARPLCHADARYEFTGFISY